jgi:hypothetical protein
VPGVGGGRGRGGLDAGAFDRVGTAVQHEVEHEFSGWGKKSGTAFLEIAGKLPGVVPG